MTIHENTLKTSWAELWHARACCEQVLKSFEQVVRKKNEQAGTVLGQAQLKLELKLTSFMICCLKLIVIVKLC